MYFAAKNNVTESEFKLITLGYYFSIIGIKNKISSFFFDILIVCLCYIYFMTCFFFNIEKNFIIINGNDTD